MSTYPFRLSLFIITVAVSSCATGKRYVNIDQPFQASTSTANPLFTLYAIGDAGEENAQSIAVINDLAANAKDDTQERAIIFLGDNIYPAGLAPPSDHDAYTAGALLLQHQNEMLAGFPGRVIYIPGNHDWNEFKPGGLEAIRRQGDFIKTLPNPNLRFLPSDGCGDPVVLSPVDNLKLIIIDSQWWIQDWSKEPAMNEGCAVQSREQFIKHIKAILEANPDDQLIFIMHHPMETQGPHGGNFTLRDHLFPLSKVVDWLYLPLPVIGSIYPWYRTIFGHPQDLKNKRYRSLQESLYELLGDRQQVIFLSGHDHNLQYIRKHGNHFIVSGSGAKQNAIANDESLVYGHKAAGYAALDIYQDRSVALRIWEIGLTGNKRELAFSHILVDGNHR